MVLPDGRGTEPERPSVGRSVILAVALLAVGVGILLMGTLTEPRPAALEDSVTTTAPADIEPPLDLENFSLSQIETGPELAWSEVAEMRGSSPKSLVAHRGMVYVFSPAASDGSGVKAWRTTVGAVWQDLGTVIDATHLIGSIASTSLGLIALEPDARDDYVHVWGSVDGMSWLEIVDGIPVTGSREDVDFYPSAIAADDRLLAVAGRVEPDVTRLAEKYLENATGDRVDLTDVPIGWVSSPEDLYMTIYGPLGFPVERISGDQLGLSDEQREEIGGYFLGRSEDATIWTKADDGEWQVGEVEGAAFISALTPHGDDALRAFGTGYVPGSWISHDGVDWEKVNDSRTPTRVEVWGDRLVGIGDSGLTTDVMLSTDGESWRDSGLAEEFPPGVNWYPLGFATGPGGIAVALAAVADEFPRGVPESPVLKAGETTLTLDYQRGAVHLDDGEALYTWSVGMEDADGVDIDLAARTVRFADPENGEVIAEFDFEELFDLESRPLRAGIVGEGPTGLAFSDDGVRWTIQDLTTEIGPDAAVTHLEVTQNEVFALVERSPEWDRPYGVEGFEVWSAPIP